MNNIIVNAYTNILVYGAMGKKTNKTAAAHIYSNYDIIVHALSLTQFCLGTSKDGA